MLSLGLFVRFSTGGKLIKCSPMLKRNSHKGQPFNVYHQRQGEKPVKLEEASDALAVVFNVNRFLQGNSMRGIRPFFARLANIDKP